VRRSPAGGDVEDKAVMRDGAQAGARAPLAEGGDPAAIVEAEELGAMGDGGELADVVARAIEGDPDAADKVRAANAKAIGALVGRGDARDEGPRGRRRGDPADPRAAGL